MLNLVGAMDDPHLFGPWFEGPSWNVWRTVLRAAYALPPTEADLATFKDVAGGRDWPTKRAREFWAIAGRRAGKDSIASLIVAFTAATFDPKGKLRPGERALCLCLASDKEQAKIVLGLIKAFFTELPVLARMVQRDTNTGFELSNSVDVAVYANDFRSVRGRTILCAVFDEVAYWASDDSASPDTEVFRAVLPGMMTLRSDATLIGISSPYRRGGLLYQKYKAHYGESGPVLVVKGASMTFNPSLDPEEIAGEIAADPAAGEAEYLGNFRNDVDGFLTFELVNAAVDTGVTVRPPMSGPSYFAFVDSAGGTGKDAFTLGIAHREQQRVILDCAHEVKPPFSAESAVEDCARIVKEYGLTHVVGDKWAKGFVEQGFSRHGIQYKYSERTRSEIYLETLPLFTSGKIRLLDNARLVTQFANLERTTHASGRDNVNHRKHAHDDLANAVAGALVLASKEEAQMGFHTPFVAGGMQAYRDSFINGPGFYDPSSSHSPPGGWPANSPQAKAVGPNANLSWWPGKKDDGK